MLKFIEILKVIFLGIVEGISEWLPISSSGHMLLVDEFIKLSASLEFKEMFFIIIQLGAILAIVCLFFKKLFPFSYSKGEIIIDRSIINIWIKVIIASLPGAIIAFLFDDFVNDYLSTPLVISLMLIIYGIIFIVVEKFKSKNDFRCFEIKEITVLDALAIGLFQMLAIIPGTSRSGATIIGALLIGVSREAGSEFSFYLSIPVMIGMSLLKIVKLGFNFTGFEILLLFIGSISAFLVSLLVVRFLMKFIKNHSFKLFGVYRILIGIVLIIYFSLL